MQHIRPRCIYGGIAASLLRAGHIILVAGVIYNICADVFAPLDQDVPPRIHLGRKCACLERFGVPRCNPLIRQNILDIFTERHDFYLQYGFASIQPRGALLVAGAGDPNRGRRHELRKLLQRQRIEWRQVALIWLAPAIGGGQVGRLLDREVAECNGNAPLNAGIEDSSAEGACAVAVCLYGYGDTFIGGADGGHTQAQFAVVIGLGRDLAAICAYHRQRCANDRRGGAGIADAPRDGRGVVLGLGVS